jgi:hypothetical protein
VQFELKNFNHTSPQFARPTLPLSTPKSLHVMVD